MHDLIDNELNLNPTGRVIQHTEGESADTRSPTIQEQGVSGSSLEKDSGKKDTTPPNDRQKEKNQQSEHTAQTTTKIQEELHSIGEQQSETVVTPDEEPQEATALTMIFELSDSAKRLTGPARLASTVATRFY